LVLRPTLLRRYPGCQPRCALAPTRPTAPPWPVPDKQGASDAMAGVREKKPRAKPGGRSRRRPDDAGLLEPLAPPDVFAALATERLILRPLIPEDAEALHNLVNDFEVARNLSVVPFPYPRELADEWIDSTRLALADGSAFHLAITGREGEHEILVGVVGVRVDAPHRCGRIGYWVCRRFWGHGVATEAGQRLARW